MDISPSALRGLLEEQTLIPSVATLLTLRKGDSLSGKIYYKVIFRLLRRATSTGTDCRYCITMIQRTKLASLKQR